MNLVNIYNKGSDIFLFQRKADGSLYVEKDTTFKPFFYEPTKGKPQAFGYDGTPLRKMVCDFPSEIPKLRSRKSYSSDIIYTKNYITHKIEKFDKCNFKYFFIDIEIFSSGGLPDPENPIDPVSCITVYNSAKEEYKTWWIKDYGVNETNKNDNKHVLDCEHLLLEDFLMYFKSESPDLFLAWNVDFDYNYLYNRFKKYHKVDLASDVSPISEVRGSRTKGVFYPAGISVLDYLLLFKKVFMREASYKLDYVAQKHLKEEPWAETDFRSLDNLVRDKNINDVVRMVKIEKKFKILDYFDEIRILCTCLWEDLYFNSFLIEMILFRLAKNKGVVLPNIPKTDNNETFEGATREAKKTGALFDIGKFDLGSAYPNMIVSFCLDPVNITTDTLHPNAIDIQGLTIIQNQDALCPTMVKHLLTLKDNQKEILESTIAGTEERKEQKRKYDAIKGVVNSAFGVFGLSNFRLYDNRIASRIAGLARECLTYCKDKMAEIGETVVYWDTDSVFIEGKDDLTDVLNYYIKEWGQEKYGVDSINVEFTYEGYFRRLFILARCRYIGDLVDPHGNEEQEIKGVEMKRSSSTEFEKEFQKNLFELILNKKNKEDVLEWVHSEQVRIKKVDIQKVAFPCKITNREYKNVPIFIRAYKNTKELANFNVETGELFYYIYVKPRRAIRLDEEGNPVSDIVDVLAFKNEKTIYFSDKDIDWEKIIERNIISKAETVFEAMGWSTLLLKNDGQTTLF